jgi:hypothetical protein
MTEPVRDQWAEWLLNRRHHRPNARVRVLKVLEEEPRPSSAPSPLLAGLAPVQVGVGDPCGRGVDDVVPEVRGGRLSAVLEDGCRDVQRREDDLLGALHQREVRHGRRGPRKTGRLQEPSHASPARAVVPVDQVGEPGFGLFVLRLDVQHFLGSLSGGLARAAATQLHLQGADDLVDADRGVAGIGRGAGALRRDAFRPFLFALPVRPLAGRRSGLCYHGHRERSGVFEVADLS